MNISSVTYTNKTSAKARQITSVSNVHFRSRLKPALDVFKKYSRT